MHLKLDSFRHYLFFFYTLRLYKDSSFNFSTYKKIKVDVSLTVNIRYYDYEEAPTYISAFLYKSYR